MKTIEEKQEEIFKTFVDNCKAAKLTKKEIHIILCNLLANNFTQVHLIGVTGRQPNKSVFRYNYGFNPFELIGALEYSKMNIVIDKTKPERIEKFITQK